MPGTKRVAESKEALSPSKKAKIEPEAIFHKPSLAWDANELYKRGVDNENGFISCQCIMSWKPTHKKYQTVLEIAKGARTPHRVEVKFLGGCVDFFDRIRFQANDTMLISLHGVKINRTGACKNSCSLPMELSYDEGVIIKFTRHLGRSTEKLVNTWTLLNAQVRKDPMDSQVREDSMDWFTSTPQIPEPPVEPSRNTPNPPTPGPTQAIENVSPLLDPTVPTTSTASTTDAVASTSHTNSIGPSTNETYALAVKRVNEAMNTEAYASAVNKANEAVKTLSASTTVPTTSGSTSRNEDVQSTTKPEKKLVCDPPVDSGDGSTAAPGPALTKKQLKRLRKQQRRAENANKPAEDIWELEQPILHPVAACSAAREPTPVENAQNGGSSNGRQVASTPEAPDQRPAGPVAVPTVEKPTVLNREDDPIPEQTIAKSDPKPEGPLAMQAGTMVGADTYVAIKKLAAGKTSNFIGIVSFCKESRVTSTGDWTINVKLLDPSNTEVEYFGNEGFHINFFALHQSWLPQVNTGDVLLVRDIKISDRYGTLVGTAYKDRGKWAVYSPTTKQFSHGDQKGTPAGERLAGGEGVYFSPLYDPERATEPYCQRLCNWWEAVQKARKEFLGDNQVDAVPYGHSQRVHRLIDDIGPDQPPLGYFNCTVEILHGHLNDNGVYSLYVTDYTKNDLVAPVTASWCLQSLRKYVLKIEAWDAAGTLAREMKTGEYYSIRNARAIISRGGYLEGKLQETKWSPLDPADAYRHPHLNALLERKKAHEAAHPDDTQNVFPDSTIAEAIEGQFFNCIVEVIQSVPDRNSLSYLLVTDYTLRSDTQQVFTEHHSFPEGSILRIDLWEQQVQKAHGIEKGRFYAIQKLRLKKDVSTGRVIGKLGGSETLITLVNAYTNQEKLVPLLKRKESIFKPALSVQQPPASRVTTVKTEPSNLSMNTPPKEISTREAPPITSSEPKRPFPTSSIVDIVQNPERPNVFFVRGRVIDYRPTDLREVVTLHCRQCDKDIPNTSRACTRCCDFEYEYREYLYGMAVLLQDEHGNKLQVAIHDQAPPFAGLEKRDTRDDMIAYNAVLRQLEPILGHSARRRNARGELLDSPWLNLTLDSWKIQVDEESEEGEIVYALAGFEK